MGRNIAWESYNSCLVKKENFQTAYLARRVWAHCIFAFSKARGPNPPPSSFANSGIFLPCFSFLIFHFYLIPLIILPERYFQWRYSSLLPGAGIPVPVFGHNDEQPGIIANHTKLFQWRLFVKIRKTVCSHELINSF